MPAPYTRNSADDIMHAINLAVVAILSLLVLLMVVRPLVRRVVTPDESVPALGPPLPDAAAFAQQQGAASLPVVPGQPLAPLTRPENMTTRQIDFAQLQGEVHQQSIQKVGELASRNPYETVSILRQWMHEKTA